MSDAHYVLTMAFFGSCVMLLGLCLLILVIYAVLLKLAVWRERRSMLVRDAQLQRYNLIAFRGVRDRFLS